MTEHDDALWDPQLKPDAQLQRIVHALKPYSLAAQGLHAWAPRSLPRPRRFRVLRTALFAALAASAVLAIGFWFRLSWSDSQPWAVAGEGRSDIQHAAMLAPGEVLATGAGDSLSIDVARIGRLLLSPDSKLQLLETRTGRHRVLLQSGHLRARIWAPPGYFGVSIGNAEVVDLGCDFDLWKEPDGSGQVQVRSGWVSYRIQHEEILLPAGYTLRFDASRAATPLRLDASFAFADAVRQLEQALTIEGPDSPEAASASDAAAAVARDADAFTLLSLLSRHPRLAAHALYPRLARALRVEDMSDAHRTAWVQGDLQAVNAWWHEYPSQPKQWWSQWADALP